MSNSCFTICTKSHIANAVAAISSIRNNTELDIDYYIFVLDKDINVNDIDKIKIINTFDNSIFNTHYQNLIKKYGSKSDETRWTMKSLVMIFLLETQYKQCVYVDPDIFFIDDVKHLFENIDQNIILTPHFRSMDSNNFNVFNLTDGYFNAGFIGSSNNKNCLDILYWWFEMCLKNCNKNTKLGFYDDQKYLDLMYIHFNKHITNLNNKGYNIAQWNIDQYSISMLDDKFKFLIDNEFNPVFFHFSTCDHIRHPVFVHYYNLYKKAVKEYRNTIKI